MENEEVRANAVVMTAEACGNEAGKLSCARASHLSAHEAIIDSPQYERLTLVMLLSKELSSQES